MNGDGINYDPPASLGDGIHHYRRKTYVSYDGAVCESITSTVTLELGSGSAPTMTVTAVNTTDSSVISPTGTSLFICPGDSVDFNAAGSSGNGFEYFLNFRVFKVLLIYQLTHLVLSQIMMFSKLEIMKTLTVLVVSMTNSLH